MDSSRNVASKRMPKDNVESNVEEFFGESTGRYRSYSASGGTGNERMTRLKTTYNAKIAAVTSALNERAKQMKTATGTQTFRSFLTEQAMVVKTQSDTSDSRSKSGSPETSSDTHTHKSTTPSDGDSNGVGIDCTSSKSSKSSVESFVYHKYHHRNRQYHTNRTHIVNSQRQNKIQDSHVTLKRTETKQIAPKHDNRRHVSVAIQTSQSLLNLQSPQIDYRQFSDGFDGSDNDRRPISWFIPIDNDPFRRISKSKRTLIPKRNDRQLTSTPVTLQNAFKQNCGDVLMASQMRVHRIQLSADYRKRTADQRSTAAAKAYHAQQETEKLIDYVNLNFKTVYHRKRIFTHKEMRAQTEKLYVKLPEVIAQKEQKKKEEHLRTHRILAQIYKYKLKDYALKGKVHWTITENCLSY